MTAKRFHLSLMLSPLLSTHKLLFSYNMLVENRKKTNTFFIGEKNRLRDISANNDYY